MRPLMLRMTGLRSYRIERTVNFTELSLVAIIGPTGAGKSSLLEAITYALLTVPRPGTSERSRS